MALDFGRKRTGIAVTDPAGIIATGLTTVSSETIFQYLDQYMQKETISTIVLGQAKQMNNSPSESMQYIEPFFKKLTAKYANINVVYFDERFTSKMAFQAMIDGGMKQKDRRNKEMIDQVSATILLQSYMEYLTYSKK
jgi:putative Holliday junction resolvase